jgi:hypothetical protein
MPPAFQKYLAASALAKVTVCVNVIVQADWNDPVLPVLLVVPVNTPYSVPEAAAKPRLVLMLLMSVATALSTLIVVPVVGAVLAVIEVAVWLPIELKRLTRVAHWVAVTRSAGPGLGPATVAIAVCPHPLSPDPVLQMLLMFGDPVLTNPL